MYGQGTVQNETPSFPESLAGLISQTGTTISGLNEWQYKIGADIYQHIWDGGASKTERKIEHAEDEERRAALDVQLYAIRERVEDLYFGILLIEEQAQQIRDLQTLLQSNLDKLRAMLRNGTVLQSDVDMVEAQYLSTTQQLTQAESAANSQRKVLELFTGKSLAGQKLMKPDATLPQDLLPNRPEQRYFETQIRTNEARNANITAGTMPKIGLFVQTYYGYPGFNYFESMMNRDLSFNLLAGVKVSWNIGAFYTLKKQAAEITPFIGPYSRGTRHFPVQHEPEDPFATGPNRRTEGRHESQRPNRGTAQECAESRRITTGQRCHRCHRLADQTDGREASPPDRLLPRNPTPPKHLST